MIQNGLFIVVAAALLLVNVVGVALVALQLPGTWLMLLATGVVAWLYGLGWDVGVISGRTLVLLLGLAVVGEIVEFAAGAVGAKGAGASKRAAAAAIVGGVVGAVIGTFALPIPIVGTLVGASVGAGAGSIGGDIWAGRDWQQAWRGGQGAAIGRLGGAVGKLVIAIVMWLVVGVALFWP